MDSHLSISSLCSDKSQALYNIAGDEAITHNTVILCHSLQPLTCCIFLFIVSLVHGGHAMDSADLKVLESVAETCFSRESPLQGSGPHILLDIIEPGNFGNTNMHNTQQRV